MHRIMVHKLILWVFYTWDDLIMSISQVAQEAVLVEEVEDSSNSGKMYMTGQPKDVGSYFTCLGYDFLIVGWYGTQNFNFNCTLKKMDFFFRTFLYLFRDTIKLP